MTKLFLSALIASTLLLGFVGGPIGCNTPPQTIAYKSLKSVALAAESARASYNIARKAGKVTQAQETRCLELWADYQVSELAAVKAARLDYSAPAPAAVQQALTAFILAVNTLSK